MVVYVRQANIAHGLQQVNNATSSAQAATPAPENEKLQNELLGTKDGERLECRAARRTSATHPALAAMGAINRP
jgi:hypothetical protein